MIQHPLPIQSQVHCFSQGRYEPLLPRRTLLGDYILERQHVSKPYPPYSSIKGLLLGLLRNESLPGSRVLDLETSAPKSLKKKDMEGREVRPGSCSLYQSVSQHKFYFITSLYNIYSLTCSI
jgi:hypothetical protein